MSEPLWLTSRLRSRGNSDAALAAPSSVNTGCAAAIWLTASRATMPAGKRRLIMKILSVPSLALVLLSAAPVWAQVTAADYQRAQSLRQQYESAAVFVPEPATWIGTTHKFYYRRSLANGFEFVTVDADTQQRQPSFDHNRIADALSRASGRAYNP